jgi:exopolysaccharide biosynthesis WecB/TagA/CpsF family protein
MFAQNLFVALRQIDRRVAQLIREEWARLNGPSISSIHSLPVQRRQLVHPVRFVRLFGIDVADQTLNEAVQWLSLRAKNNIKTQIAFLNTHCVNVSFSDPAYRDSLKHYSRIFADGTGVRVAARCIGMQLRDNVNGTDMFPLLCQEAEAQKLGLFLFGGADEIAGRAAASMSRCYKDLAICGTHHGYVIGSEEEQKLIDKINGSGARILLVGLGVPLQELWIARNYHRIDVPVILGVGGLFDYYSGRRSRAPRAFRRAGIEWVWRLLLEPKRLSLRYLAGNVSYLIHLAWRLAMRPNEFSPG